MHIVSFIWKNAISHSSMLIYFWLTALKIFKHLLFGREELNVSQLDTRGYCPGVNVCTQHRSQLHSTPTPIIAACMW